MEVMESRENQTWTRFLQLLQLVKKYMTKDEQTLTILQLMTPIKKNAVRIRNLNYRT